MVHGSNAYRISAKHGDVATIIAVRALMGTTAARQDPKGGHPEWEDREILLQLFPGQLIEVLIQQELIIQAKVRIGEAVQIGKWG
jgi:hypothetical protein